MLIYLQMKSKWTFSFFSLHSDISCLTKTRANAAYLLKILNNRPVPLEETTLAPTFPSPTTQSTRQAKDHVAQAQQQSKFFHPLDRPNPGAPPHRTEIPGRTIQTNRDSAAKLSSVLAPLALPVHQGGPTDPRRRRRRR